MTYTLTLMVEVHEDYGYQKRGKVEEGVLSDEQALLLMEEPERGAPLADMCIEWLFQITEPREKIGSGFPIYVPYDTRTFDPALVFVSWWLPQEASALNEKLGLASELVDWLEKKLWYGEVSGTEDSPTRMLVALRKEE